LVDNGVRCIEAAELADADLFAPALRDCVYETLHNVKDATCGCNSNTASETGGRLLEATEDDAIDALLLCMDNARREPTAAYTLYDDILECMKSASPTYDPICACEERL